MPTKRKAPARAQVSDCAPIESDLLDERQAAQFLAISERKLWSLRSSGAIPHCRLGRTVRYRKSSLTKWLASIEQGGEE